MRDFTLNTLDRLLSSLKTSGYSFITVLRYPGDASDATIILRHDVDASPGNSLKCAELESRMGINGTYYFRMVPKSYDERIIRAISHLGHEIGYHYEDLAVARGDYDLAIKLFEQNLAKLRQLAPIETICMHGSPLSKYDNRMLWKRYNYRDYGIIGEPYLDIDFNVVRYFTDTGRRWDGENVSLRDRVMSTKPEESDKKQLVGASKAEYRQHFRSTADIIRASETGNLPPLMMITLHPQRWDNKVIPWLHELFWQNIKNVAKRFLTTY
jgi:hypothetical protein